jgi:hypothetical protein
MTRKHFVALAAALRENAPDQFTCTEAEKVLFERLVSSVAGICRGANANFDRARFEKASGVCSR